MIFSKIALFRKIWWGGATLNWPFFIFDPCMSWLIPGIYRWVPVFETCPLASPNQGRLEKASKMERSSFPTIMGLADEGS